MDFKRTIKAIFVAAIISTAAIALNAIVNTAEEGLAAKAVDPVVVTTAEAEETAAAESLAPEISPSASPTRYYPEVNLPEELQEYIFVQSGEACVDFELVLAIIIQESACDPEAVSDTGDYGLMQINKINNEEMAGYGLTDMLDPYQNVVAGITILCKMSDRYGYDEENMVKVLMAYNMGATGAANAWAKGIESTQYTDEVMQIREALICGTYNEGGIAT